MRCASSSAATFLLMTCGGLGRANGPDPIRAVHLLQIWDRLRRRRARRPDPQRAGCAGLIGKLSERTWVAARRALAQGSPRTGKHGLEPGGPQRRAYRRGMGAHGRAGCEWRPCSEGLQASLLLPMGRNGPAFLAFHNFKVYLEWNQSLVYSTTAAYLATRIAGAPAVSCGRGVVPFGYEQTKELQGLLQAKGYDVGEVDGKLGLATRASIKKVQEKLGLPANSYPALVDRALTISLRAELRRAPLPLRHPRNAVRRYRGAFHTNSVEQFPVSSSRKGGYALSGIAKSLAFVTIPDNAFGLSGMTQRSNQPDSVSDARACQGLA